MVTLIHNQFNINKRRDGWGSTRDVSEGHLLKEARAQGRGGILARKREEGRRKARLRSHVYFGGGQYRLECKGTKFQKRQRLKRKGRTSGGGRGGRGTCKYLAGAGKGRKKEGKRSGTV